MNDIRRLVDEYGVRQIDILDDNFSLNRDRARVILGKLAAFPKQLSVNLVSGIRADHVTPELARLLKRAGVYATTIGIESGDQGILDGVGKGSRLKNIV